MVGSTDSEISLHTDTNDEEDAATDANPVERVVEEGEEVLMVERLLIYIPLFCSYNFQYGKNEVEAEKFKIINPQNKCGNIYLDYLACLRY